MRYLNNLKNFASDVFGCKVQFYKHFAKQLFLFEFFLIGKNGLKVWPKIQRIFKIYKGTKLSKYFSIYIFLNDFLAKLQLTGVIAEVQTAI